MHFIDDLRYTKNTKDGEQVGTFVIRLITGVNEYGMPKQVTMACEFNRTVKKITHVRWGAPKFWDGDNESSTPQQLPEHSKNIDLVMKFFNGKDKK